MNFLAVLLVLTVAAPAEAPAMAPAVRVAAVCGAPVAIDGDTLRCAEIGPVRLLAIDAPELPGHCRRGRVCTPGDAGASKAHLARLMERGVVVCRATARDRYRRLLARCAAGGVDLSCAQVAAGHAVERYGRLRCD